MRKDSQLILYD